MPQLSGEEFRAFGQFLATVGDQRAKDLIERSDGEDAPGASE